MISPTSYSAIDITVIRAAKFLRTKLHNLNILESKHYYSWNKYEMGTTIKSIKRRKRE